MNIPKEIYLQIEDGEEFDHNTSWCGDKINDDDIKYVLENNWISVKDRLPENENHVLILINKVDQLFGFYIAEYEDGDPLGEWYWYNPCDQNYDDVSGGNIVTHWFPIPNYPK